MDMVLFAKLKKLMLETMQGAGAIKGDRGEPGQEGKQGPPGPQGEQGEPGPEGKQGPPGPEGKPGDPGKDGLTGEQGIQGQKGDPGDPFLIQKVYPTSADMAAGYSSDGLPQGALVGISTETGGVDGGHLYIKGETAYEFFFNLGEVDGLAGPPGEPGAQGPTGKQGEPGKDGEPGKSAYEIAVENGFSGTEAEWLTSIRGEPGQPGQDGQPGADGQPGNNGQPGKDATINGENTVEIVAGENVHIEQDGGTLTISATGGGGSLPPGGTAGQVLVKLSDEDGDAGWATVAGTTTAQSIAIVSPPNKTSYQVGETFDPAGMSVLVTFSDGSEVPVSTDNLTFSPSGPLDVGVTAITVTFTSGGKDFTAEQPVTVSSVHIYGASWDGTATTAWTRTDDAADFTDPVPYVAGATNYGSPFDGLQPWAGMVKSERTGGTMVTIPKFWYKLTQNGAGLSIQIADKETEGFVPSPMHMDKGDGKGERDVVYVGRYHCGASNWKSASGQTPKNNVTRSAARSNIHGLGSAIWQGDFAMRFTLWLLYIVEFADWNSQAKIGFGCGNNSGVEAMGYTDSMPYHTGTTQASRETYGLGTQYRNIEGLWDNVYDWCDGCYNNSSGLNIILNPANFSDTAGGTLVGLPSNGYPSAFSANSNSGFPMFYPTAANGSETSFSCDYWSFSASGPCVCVGGSYGRGGYRGLFCVGGGSVSSANASIGSRLQELP